MFRTCCLWVLLLMISPAYAQKPVFKWVKQFATTDYLHNDRFNSPRSIAVDPQGNVYTLGLFHSQIDFDPGPGVYNLIAKDIWEETFFISKLSPSGEFIWAKKFELLNEGPMYMTTDKQGNVYLTSELRSTTDMDPGQGVHNISPIGSIDAFILKLNTNGEFLWVKQFGSKDGDTGVGGSTVAIDNNGNVIVCGGFNNVVDFDPGPATFNLSGPGSFVTKLTPNGDFLWAAQFNTATIMDSRSDPMGNIYTTGFISGDCDFDPGPGKFNFVAGGPADGFACKLDASGKLIWAKKFGNSALNHMVFPNSMDLDGANNIGIAGSFFGTQDFDPGTTSHQLTSRGTDAFLLKLSSDGNFIWANNVGSGEGDQYIDLEIGNDDNFYTLGHINGFADVDPGPGVYNINGNGALISKFNKEGNFIYALDPDLPSWGREITVDNTLNIFVAGGFFGTADLDPGLGIFNLTTGNKGWEVFVLKLGKCLKPTAATINYTSCGSYTLNNLSYDSSGTYTQVIPNAAGCDSVITLNLTINKKFSTHTKTICDGSFYFAAGANQTTAGVYKDTVQTSSGCDSVVTLNLIVIKKFSTQEKTICEGSSYFAAGANQTSAGVYRDTVQTSSGCDSIITTTVFVNPKPLFNLGADRNLCADSLLTISPGAFNKYLWQDQSSASFFKINAAGKYWVTVTNSNGCTATDTLKINAIIQSPVNFLKPKDSICSYQKLLIQPSGFYQDYLWSTGASQSNINIEQPGIYWLKVKDANGCYGLDSISVFPKTCIQGFYMPDAFTPNNDGKNDAIKPLLFGAVKKYQFTVYNRWGEKVFESKKPGEGWDGKMKSKEDKTSVFVWICQYQLEGEEAKTTKGTVTLIR